MSDPELADFYTDLAVAQDPYPFFDRLSRLGSVVRLPAHDVVAVTDFETALAVHLDTEHLSAANSVTGPLPPLPFVPSGADIGDEIARHRPQMPFGEDLLTLDPPRHTPLRSLTMRLFTPSRLKEMEPAIARLADALIDEFAAGGRAEIVGDFATPFAVLAIAELLGVPEEDRAEFRRTGTTPSSPVADGEARAPFVNPMDFREKKFAGYIEDRRRNPREDVLGQIAAALYPDGTAPAAHDIVRIGTLLFGAGQDTTATLVGNALRILAEDAAIQERLRDDPGLIPAFIEEVLRLDGPVKATHRLVARSATIAGMEVAAGTHLMIATAAANRDPAKFDDPEAFVIGRKGGKEHLAFGRGIHTCPGAALARAEARIALERMLARFDDIAVDEARHGPPGERRIAYRPTYVFRSIDALHIRFAPK